MGILADFVQKIGFARSQCQKANKALSGSCLLMLSSFLVLEERFFKAQKVSLDKFPCTIEVLIRSFLLIFHKN